MLDRFLIYTETDEEHGLSENHYLEFKLQNTLLYAHAGGKDRRIITITLSNIHQTVQEDEVVREGKKSNSFAFDLDLKDEDEDAIAGVCCSLHCGFLNAFQHIFEKPKRKPEEAKKEKEAKEEKKESNDTVTKLTKLFDNLLSPVSPSDEWREYVK